MPTFSGVEVGHSSADLGLVEDGIELRLSSEGWIRYTKIFIPYSMEIFDANVLLLVFGIWFIFKVLVFFNSNFLSTVA